MFLNRSGGLYGQIQQVLSNSSHSGIILGITGEKIHVWGAGREHTWSYLWKGYNKGELGVTNDQQ